MTFAGVFTILFLAALLMLHFRSYRKQSVFGAFWTFPAIALMVSFNMVMWMPRMNVLESNISWINLWVIGFLLALFCVTALRLPQSHSRSPKPKGSLPKPRVPFLPWTNLSPRLTLLGTVMALLAMTVLLFGWVRFLN